MAKIEIDGKCIEVETGKMIIEVADDAGIYIPRFCYHKKLSVAANCRMCLVEVESSKKTLPACATPITDGMKVFTKSPAALRSQEAVMEFLLINHPLDCPICDQGGECELQDISMGFGRDSSIYEESKRSVDDDNLGSLISTEMTRCILCTRCVRFGEEIAGLPELGGIGRGEKTQISTYVQHSMTSEVSGNIIDLCPVGALTSKPYRFTARAWEMTQMPGVAPHDCLGSHIYFHTRRNQVMRVVPKEEETLNETWLSDRDRFSYLALNHTSRVSTPRIKRNGVWENVNWQTALSFAADKIGQLIKTHGPDQFAALASCSSTMEELYLLQKAMRNLGVHNLDHRLQQTDFRDQAHQPVMPTTETPYATLEDQKHILLVGCNIDREVPLAGLRVRKAFVNGASIHAINAVDYDYHFTVSDKIVVPPQDFPHKLALMLAALLSHHNKEGLPEEQVLIAGLNVDTTSKAFAQQLCHPESMIVTGAICDNHPDAAVIRTLVAALAQYSGAKVLRLTTGSNTAGAALAGMLPHRSCAGKIDETPGLDVQAALASNLKGYLLMSVEPEFDIAHPSLAMSAMMKADCVVVLSAFHSQAMEAYADVILPIAPYAETSGTYININGQWQSFSGAVAPHGEARPGWKVLRVLANLLHCDGFEYVSSQDVLEEIQHHCSMMHEPKSTVFYPQSLPDVCKGIVRVGEWPLYRADAMVRHAQALQDCGAADKNAIRIHPVTADRLTLGDCATVSQGDIEVTLPLIRDDRIAENTIWLANAMPETVELGHAFGDITIK